MPRAHDGLPYFRRMAIPEETVSCAMCLKDFLLPTWRTIRAGQKRIFCSLLCKNKGAVHPLTNDVIKLYREGYKLKEIAMRLNLSENCVGGLLHRNNIKERWGHLGRTGLSRHAQREALKLLLSKFCQLCGYDRVIEIAHIIPEAHGGRYELGNLLSLCPNCHCLFDGNRLTNEEMLSLRQIEEVKNAIEERIKSGGYRQQHQRATSQRERAETINRYRALNSAKIGGVNAEALVD